MLLTRVPGDLVYLIRFDDLLYMLVDKCAALLAGELSGFSFYTASLSQTIKNSEWAETM